MNIPFSLLFCPVTGSVCYVDGGRRPPRASQEESGMSQDRRRQRDLHALNPDGMVLCNPRDREAAHRAEMEGIATEDASAVTCRNCLELLHKQIKEKREQ